MCEGVKKKGRDGKQEIAAEMRRLFEMRRLGWEGWSGGCDGLIGGGREPGSGCSSGFFSTCGGD